MTMRRSEGSLFIELDSDSYAYLIHLLQEKYYTTEDISELKKINQIYKILQFKSETWLSQVK